MPVNAVTAVGGPGSIRVVGAEALPPYLTERLGDVVPANPYDGTWDPSVAAHEDDVLAESAPPSDSPNLFDLPGEGLKILTDLWDKAKAYKALLDYGRYSDKLKANFAKRFSPTDVYRVIHDFKGRGGLPSAATEARLEGRPDVASADVNRVYEFSGYIFEFFKEHFGYVLEQPMIHVVNYNDDARAVGFDNAGFNPMEKGLSMMLYGNGDGKIFKSFTSDIGVIAHELGHNFLHGKYGAKFTVMGSHYGQPGAVSEHICDVIAKCVEAKYNGWDDLVEHWFIGANLMVNPNFSLRDMAEPGSAYDDPKLGKDPQVAHMKDFVVTDDDHGGVHLNNGIMNRVFTLFAENVGGAVYATPLDVWLLALDICEEGPSFYDFSQALRAAAKRYNVEKEFLDAADKVGVLEYLVIDGRVQKTDGSDLVS